MFAVLLGINPTIVDVIKYKAHETSYQIWGNKSLDHKTMLGSSPYVVFEISYTALLLIKHILYTE